VNTLPPHADQPASDTPPNAHRRRLALATLIGAAAFSESALAQMGGPGGGGGRGGPPQDGGCARPKDEAKGPDGAPPPDLTAAFATRLRQGVPELAIAPPQQKAFADFVDSLAEVGQHNQRRLQRILWMTAASVSATSPLTSFIANEFEEGDERQQALADLKAAYARLDGALDERQRAVLTTVFARTRAELQASRAR